MSEERVTRRRLLRGMGPVAVILAGCTGGGLGADPGGDVAAPARAPATLRVHTRTGVDLDRYMVSRQPDFEARWPHLRLEIDVISGTPPEYITKLLVVQSAGEIGDAAWATSRAGYTKQLAAKGVFAPLEPLARADRFALTDYYPNALAEATWEGKLYSLPHITEPGQVGLMWNKNLFAGTTARPPGLAGPAGRDYAVHRVLSGNGGPVGRPDVWRNEQVLREIPEWKDWADMMDPARPNHVPANLRGQDLETALDTHLGNVWRGAVSPADGIKQAVAAVQEVLRQPAA